MNYIVLYTLLFILITYFYISSYKYKESFIPDSNHIINNIYKPYGIIIDKQNKNLIYNGKIINYTNKLNDNLQSKLISNNKIKTNQILKQNEFPVCNFLQWNNNITDESNIINVNNQLQFPLVVKYNLGCKGKDVYTDIITNEQLINKINYLKSQNKNSIIIEEQTYGDKYRIMILNDKFIYANKQIIPKIKGDGISSINQLINNYPKKINLINDDLIYQQGYYMNDILENNKEIIVTNVLSSLNGIGEIPVLEKNIHPINLNMFKKLNKLIGLDFSGIDYIGPDLSIPYFDKGKIIEINADPTFNIQEQKKKGIVRRFINALF
tara:strand:- start:125 stop:1096 length:972 start_codon:yes stop_codon:yes gene_type:complete